MSRLKDAAKLRRREEEAMRRSEIDGSTPALPIVARCLTCAHNRCVDDDGMPGEWRCVDGPMQLQGWLHATRLTAARAVYHRQQGHDVREVSR